MQGYETSAFPKYLSQVQSSSTQVLQNNNRFDIIFCSYETSALSGTLVQVLKYSSLKRMLSKI